MNLPALFIGTHCPPSARSAFNEVRFRFSRLRILITGSILQNELPAGGSVFITDSF